MQVLHKAEAPTSRLRAGSMGVLLEGLIDYAGLFPPAKLPMTTAVGNYAEYIAGEFRWMAGRFIVPVARLAEFEDAVQQHAGRIETGWSLSALVGSDAAADAARVAEFNESHKSIARVSALEIKASTSAEILAADKVLPREMDVFFEIPLSENMGDCVATLAKCRRNAKARTGGETPEMIPSSMALATFMQNCVQTRVAFKATAGLHHPVRSVHPLTYAANSPLGTMHGFLNVFLAAAFLKQGMDLQTAIALLDETSVAAFRFDDNGTGWGSHSLTARDLKGARESVALSFGSCSFDEPLDDLLRFFPA